MVRIIFVNTRLIDVFFQLRLNINQGVKRFEKVKHYKLHQLLVSRNIDSEDVRIISNLHILLLFHLYNEAIFRETLEDELVGIVIS